jgi:hypothetical protein
LALDLRQEVSDLATAKTAGDGFLRARPHLKGTPLLESAGLNFELEQLFGPNCGLLIKHRHARLPSHFG